MNVLVARNCPSSERLRPNFGKEQECRFSDNSLTAKTERRSTRQSFDAAVFARVERYGIKAPSPGHRDDDEQPRRRRQSEATPGALREDGLGKSSFNQSRVPTIAAHNSPVQVFSFCNLYKRRAPTNASNAAAIKTGEEYAPGMNRLA